MVGPGPRLSDQAISYFEARERRLTLALRVAEVLNSLVRPVLAIVFGGATVWLAIDGTITSGEFLTVSAVVILYFFKARDDEKAQDRLSEQQAELVSMARDLPPPSAKAPEEPT